MPPIAWQVLHACNQLLKVTIHHFKKSIHDACVCTLWPFLDTRFLLDFFFKSAIFSKKKSIPCQLKYNGGQRDHFLGYPYSKEEDILQSILHYSKAKKILFQLCILDTSEKKSLTSQPGCMYYGGMAAPHVIFVNREV